jgi:hypothetical protein
MYALSESFKREGSASFNYKRQNRETWYSTSDLETYFNIKGPDLKKYIKAAFLKARTVSGKQEKIHLQVFLIKETKDVLPPKKLLKPTTASSVECFYQ